MTDPIARFQQLLERALRSDILEPTAMALATATREGRPSVRMVLLKQADESGFVFYTNLQSRKAGELEENPHAALCFHWQPLEVQVRIEGTVTHVPDAEANAYFGSRPRASQVGAWASQQSRPLGSYAELERNVEAITTRYADAPIPRPPYWSGYRLVPEVIEFWSGRPSRLHEREVFTRRAEGGWSLQMLYP